MEWVSCALCGRDDAAPYREEGGYRAVRCDGCDLLYVNPRPTVDEMKRLYDGQDTHVSLTAHIAARDEQTALARFALDQLKPHRPGGRVLDVGSGAGYFLAAARSRGYTVQGLDIAGDFVKFCQQVHGIDTAEGTLCSAGFPAGSFDIIHMRNVLSHLAHPRQELSLVRELLSDGGVLYLETGNVAELPASAGFALELPDHLFHYSRRSLVALLEASGFEVLSLRAYTLLMQFALFRALRGGPPLAKEVPVRRGGGSSARLALPRSTISSRVGARAGLLLRYGLGAVLPCAGHRCSLVAIARRLP